MAHFITLSFWESREAIITFAGNNPEEAKYYPEDRQYLLRLEPTVAHYDVFQRFELNPAVNRCAAVGAARSLAENRRMGDRRY